MSCNDLIIISICNIYSITMIKTPTPQSR